MDNAHGVREWMYRAAVPGPPCLPDQFVGTDDDDCLGAPGLTGGRGDMREKSDPARGRSRRSVCVAVAGNPGTGLMERQCEALTLGCRAGEGTRKRTDHLHLLSRTQALKVLNIGRTGTKGLMEVLIA